MGVVRVRRRGARGGKGGLIGGGMWMIGWRDLGDMGLCEGWGRNGGFT